MFLGIYGDLLVCVLFVALLIILLKFYYSCSVGIVFAYISNEQVNESIRNFDNTINAALNGSLDFVDDVQMVGTFMKQPH